MNRRKFITGAAGIGTLALAGCIGGGTKVQEDEIEVEGDIDLSKIELDIQSQENGEWGTSESSITIYPEDDVVCYGEGDGTDEHTGCVRSAELTQKYLDIYRREKEEQEGT